MRKRKSTPLPESEHEDRRTIIEKLVEQGYQNKEIAEKTGIPVGSVARYATAFRKQKKEKEKGKTEKNADRHLCMSCKYRSARTEVNGCDYAGIMEHSRYARIVGEDKPCELLKLAEVIEIVEGGGVDGEARI